MPPEQQTSFSFNKGQPVQVVGDITQPKKKLPRLLLILFIIILLSPIILILGVSLISSLKGKLASGVKGAYLCDNNSKINFRVGVSPDWLEGDGFGYSYVYKTEDKEVTIHSAGYAQPDNFIDYNKYGRTYPFPPLPVNTKIKTKVFELPQEEQSLNLINIFIPKTISENDFDAISRCFEANREKVNSDLLYLDTLSYAKQSSDSSKNKRIGGLAYIGLIDYMSLLQKSPQFDDGYNKIKDGIIIFYGKGKCDVFSKCSYITTDFKEGDASAEGILSTIKKNQEYFGFSTSTSVISQ
jgi:hypothetical protein